MNNEWGQIQKTLWVQRPEYQQYYVNFQNWAGPR